MKEALNILKKEKKDALFYFAFMVVSIFVMTFYISIIFSHPVENAKSTSTLIVNGLSLLVICFVVVLSFFAGQSLLNKEMRIIAIYKLAGVSLEKMMKFLVGQLTYLLVLAFPIGYVLGVFVASIYEYFVYDVLTFCFSWEALLSVIFCLGIEVFYLGLVSVGFIYKNEVLDLLKYQTIMNREMIQLKVTNFAFPEWTILFFFTVFYVFGLMAELSEKAILPLGIILIYMFYNKLITKAFYWIMTIIKDRCLNQPQMLLVLSHGYAILKKIKYFIQILAFLSYIMITQSRYFNGSVKTQIMVMFMITLCCMLFALVYQINLLINNHQKEFNQLKKLGFSTNKRKQLLNKEVVLVYIIILVLSLLVSVPFGLKILHLIDVETLIQVSISYVLGLGCAMFINLKLVKSKISTDF